jgi:diguanylate cyclase (GGDEF)-like protein/PAS domain S-box-containing protein
MHLLYETSTQYYQKSDKKDLYIKYWQLFYVISVGLAGSVWGSSVFFLFPADSNIHQLIIVLFLAGIIGGSVGLFSPLMLAFLAYTLPITILVSIKFMLVGNMFSIIITIVCWVLFISMTIAARHSGQAIRNALTLKFDNETLKHEIVARKKAEELLELTGNKLSQKEKELRQLLNSTGEGIYGIDLEGKCTFANQSCLRILGYDSVDELIGKNMHKQIHHHYKDGRNYLIEHCHIFKAIHEGKGTTNDNEVLWCKDGHAFPAEYNSFPIIEDGKTVGAVISFIDITERKLAEEQIRISEEKYRLAMEANQDGLWDWNVVSGDVFYNSGWEQILGEKNIEHHYQSWEKRIYYQDKEKVINSLHAHLAGETEIWQEEHRLKNNNGEWIWVLGRGQVVKRDEQGKALRMIGTVTDISIQKENEKEIQHQANYDSLTLLPNRKLFNELLTEEIKKAQRGKSLLWILFLDLDGFKEINDKYGHHMGDELLIVVANRIQSILRKVDIVARLGGDEFVVILSSISDISDVDHIASNLINVISAPCKLSEQEVSVTVSIGIASFPKDTENSEDLIKFSDQSMYAAKKEGKNQYIYFTPEVNTHEINN